MNARLPDAMLEATIAGMYPGTTGYCVSWAMVVDENRECWIRGDYSIHDEPGGTVKMNVRRNKDGFCVKIPRGELYSPQQISEQEHRDWKLMPVEDVRLA